MKKIITHGTPLAIILGLIFPMEGMVKSIITFLLGAMLFFSFLKLELKFKNFFRKEVLYYLIIGLGIMPAGVYFLTKNLDTPLRIGFLLIALTPTATGAPVIVDMIGGNRELIVSNTVFYNLISPLTYAFLLKLYLGNTVNVPMQAVFMKTLVIIIIPLILAIAVRSHQLIKNKLINFSKIFNPLSLVILIWAAVAAASLKLRDYQLIFIVEIFLAVFSFCIFSFIAGYYLSKDEETRKTLSSAFGQKNTALTIYVALLNFSSIAAIPTVMYIICHHLVNAYLIKKYHS